MESSVPKTYFQGIRSRELNGFRVRKRPYMDDLSLNFSETGVVTVEHDGDETPPMAVSFGKTIKGCHILAVSDEDGYVSLFDTRRKLPSSSSHQHNAEKARVCDWVAHQNAVFDVLWIKDDTHILTASGDQTIKLWDVQENKCTAALMGHTGSVKSLCAHPSNADLVVSGSRDGSFVIWDLRCRVASRSRRMDHQSIFPAAMVKGAHHSAQSKRVRRGKAASVSITSVLYLKDEVSIATAGAVDSTVKFWDTRNLKTAVTQTSPHSGSSEKEKRLHGICSLSQDLDGVYLTASCMDNRMYLYNVLQLDKGPIKSFTGCKVESFYVKSAISPDGAHILSGSSDGNAYVWQVNKPEEDPIILKKHDGDVTAVDWCQFEVGKIATASDDFTVRTWNIQSSDLSSTRSSSSIRRRVMAIPSAERRELELNEPVSPTKTSDNLCPSDKAEHQNISSNPITMPKISTPEAHKMKHSSNFALQESFQKTPESTMESPSSVLDPPSSLKKRTICDYFLAAL